MCAELDSHHTSFENIDTAKVVYARGVTRVWTEADTHAKRNYLTAILLGIGVFVLNLHGPATGRGHWRWKHGHMPASRIAIVTCAWCDCSHQWDQAKSATQYFDEMAVCEEQMPPFSRFFQAYLVVL